MKLIACCIVVFLGSFSLLKTQPVETINNWPHWRGVNADGVAMNGTPPTEWSETKNIKWKTPIPGKGLSTPVVWDNQIFITAAIDLDQEGSKEDMKEQKESTSNASQIMNLSDLQTSINQFLVYCLDLNSGNVIWKKAVHQQLPHQGIHRHASLASPSCATNGKYVIAYFGSYGLYCFDLNGNLLWEQDFGDMEIYGSFGEGASVLITDHKVIIVWDHEQQSKIFALDIKTGNNIWQKERDERTTWATPVVVSQGNKKIIAVAGENQCIGYNSDNGDVMWQFGGLGSEIISSPVANDTMVYFMSGASTSKKILMAINTKKACANADSAEFVAWIKEGKTANIPSPVLSNGKLYYLRGFGSQLTCIDAQTGKIYYEIQRPKGLRMVYASPVAANGFIYIVDRDGSCALVKEGETFEVFGINKLDDGFDASPVIVGNKLLLRGHKYLYCIAE